MAHVVIKRGVMLPAYDDIRSRIPEPPVWYDQHGVPRYDSFRPEMLGVYDHFAVLGEIACQSCGRRFLVAESWPLFDMSKETIPEYVLADLVEGFTYGDPPRHDIDVGRCAGETMSSDVVRIVETWERVGLGWVQRPVE